ncbi:DUF2759 domain-containing protein [Microbacterium sp. APC 3898]|uniref:DUF2759 domain-containing protein n=2 Tax=Planococcus TaxID=1372 RepID=A0ABT7ZI31_9BACL|nr:MULTISPECIES: DUF2759 domain-containing protein [Terrabacteria group]MBF6632849.1 DUF2759 domain-containing protein [Planococcus sp. (in: firmicutes)]MBD8015696.1 DUF2759 domain-containing protein [Planococcus wigleyi]MDN3426815.1 DUF2759 domain-containing protein [Planococcus sp. APC 4016]MDN3438070.1 DUF2759 domain-containing protein [Planococcus sp. APC 3900]MDN3500325.1 DUF2759 domain-containing protein [Microbacterium sp. APC 3898]
MSWMLLVIFGLIAILAAVGTLQTLKNKEILGFLFNFGTLVIFGGFTIATLITQGYPPALH